MRGVDLRVRAEVDGFAEELVVKTREATTDPALTAVRFSVATTGVSLTRDGAGNLAAVSATGGTVFHAPAPAMWDSAPEPSGSAAGEAVPRRREMGVQLSAGALTVTPDRSFLTDPDAVLPIVIDPSWSYGRNAWTTVWSASPNSHGGYPSGNDLALGYQGYEPTITVVKSYLQFALDSRIWNSNTLSATLKLYESHAGKWTEPPKCEYAASQAQVFRTGGIDSATTRLRQPAWYEFQSQVATAYGNDNSPAPCNQSNWAAFDVTPGVRAVSDNHTGITLGLRSSNDADAYGWRRYASGGAATTPKIDVVFNHAPDTPTASDLKTELPNSTCEARADAPRVNITPNGGVDLLVRPSDRDKPYGDKVKARVQFWRNGESAAMADLTSGEVAPDSWVRFSQVLRTKTLTDGSLYFWRSIAYDHNGLNSGWSAYCWLLADRTAPAQPLVSSADYPIDAYMKGAGSPGVFDFAPGDVDVTQIKGFWYGIDQPTPGKFAPAAGAAHTASRPDTPASYGPHDMWVQAQDTAGNKSSPVRYHFFVKSPTDAVGYWRLDEPSGTTALDTVETPDPDDDNPDYPATLGSSGVSWAPGGGKVDGGLAFSGANAEVVTAGPVVHTEADFSVTAWVKLATKSRAADAVSVSGTRVGAFFFQYRPDVDRWTMVLPRTDTDSAVEDRVDARAAPVLNQWHHLAGVYRAATKEASLYVDGVFQGTLVRTTPWHAAGPLRMGSVLWNGATRNFLTGSLDSVRAYDRVLTDGEISDVVNHDDAAAPVGTWHLDEATGAVATDSAAGARPATLHGGAAFTPNGRVNGGLALDGSTGYAATASYVVQKDKSFTVAAWARLNAADRSATVVSQDGSSTRGLVLRYEPDQFFGGHWVFRISGSSMTDQNGPTLFANEPTAWTHLAASYDGFTHELKLRVHEGGTYPTTATSYRSGATLWYSLGPMQLGRNMVGTDDVSAPVFGYYLAGVVDEVNLYTGVVPELALRQLALQQP
jgi:Concanavalin A-like lectin/glucanases superfamily